MQLAGIGTAIAATGSITGCADQNLAQTSTNNETRSKKALYVPNGKNRFQENLMIWGVIPLQIKISGKDTDESLFLFAHQHIGKSGPPLHFHYEQDEWFYALEA